MKLITDYNDEVIDDPDDDTILHYLVYTVENIVHLSGESVMLAEETEDEDTGIPFLQATYDKDKPGWILLITRSSDDGQSCDLYRAVQGPFTTMSVAAILQQHAKGDVSWQHNLHWKRVKAIHIETLLGILLTVIIAVVIVIGFFVLR